ncbi:hsc62, Hsp70 family chaperone, binds to RpoD and inhibits transcription [Lysobacter capsici]|uniref:Chaperone protein DnaK n=1 Tax=Lysobacter capsici AZ78 TaxID=1444315 RepID=A0A125U073_9GAMM|nr:molecular chaperone HscC [Lysobacter capsici]ALN86461.1 hsc62, Hsp70 family chaperone, binds to RpoD and inhibits transcription [Lysobacter capsici]KWS02438.1 Chaperone protein DnaK [Lysobacter capsici AZ78]
MIVGIDLGTTHSLIGVYGPDGPRLIPNALGSLLTPSVVSVGDDEEVIVGRAARERLVSHPQRSVAAFKRWMGTDRVTALGTHRFRPEELSALILKSLIADAEAELGQKVAEAVISVPAYFSDSQRKATRIAGELAGIKVERLINEPTAAALAYGLQQREGGGRYLVFDLGGGTFDVSILELFEGVMEVHASAGDNFLGGEDFTQALLNAFLADSGLSASQLALSELATLERRIETLKHDLARGNEATLELPLAGEPRQWRIDEAGFARVSEPLVQRLRAPLERAMRDAKLSPGQLDEIVLVGGASRMQLSARLVSRMFGRLPLRHVNPDEAIGLGACVAAGMKARDQSLEEIILTDVCPHTLGVNTTRESQGGYTSGVFSPIIHRNSTVPVSRVERYYPTHDGQRQVEIQIYQGESPRVENNVRLGAISIDLPSRRRDENAIDVRFTYDINGLLQVEATLASTGLRHEVLVEKNPGVLSQEEIRERLAALAALKVHPRDQQENIALIARAERLYEELLWAREQLQAALVQFRGVLDLQDSAVISEHRGEFVRFLDAVESQGYT